MGKAFSWKCRWHLLRFALQEEKNQQKASESKEVLLYGQFPPIDKMDASISTLVACEYEQSTILSHCLPIYCRKLSLSTNMIEKIANLNGLSKTHPADHHLRSSFD